MSSFIGDFICGSLSGTGYCISGYILDTVKVRMQVDPSLRMVETLRSSIIKEGYLSLFSGIYYPLVTIPLVNAIIFSSYEFYKKIRNKQQLSFIDGIQNGAFAGLANTIVISPVELIKCKMQTQAQKYRNSQECMRDIVKNHGIQGLFKGSFSTAARQVFAYAAQFAVYQFLKNKMVPHGEYLSFVQGLFVGALAGFTCWVFSYPQDLIKTYIQLAPAGTYKFNRWLMDGGFFDCGRQIFKEYGINGFFIGIKPCLIRAAVANGIGIAIYEECQAFWKKSFSKSKIL